MVSVEWVAGGPGLTELLVLRGSLKIALEPWVASEPGFPGILVLGGSMTVALIVSGGLGARLGKASCSER